MRYWIDTEFIERPCTIQLISLGIVAEDDREFYAVCEHDPSHASRWVRRFVLPAVAGEPQVPRQELGHQVLAFLGADRQPEFWGWYAAYDWVAFRWLFGAMGDGPRWLPYFCHDLAQLAEAHGNTSLPDHGDDRHHALADARWTRRAYEFVVAAATGSPDASSSEEDSSSTPGPSSD